VAECYNLNTGGKLVIEPLPYVKSAAVGVYIKVGSRHEKAGLEGASHFIEHMLFKGTEQRTARDIAEGMEEMGGQLNAFTAKEYTCLYTRTLDEDIYSAIDIIFDMLFNSTMASKDYDTEGKVIIEEINMYEDTPDELIHDVFARNFWQDHPIGNSILGTLQSIGAMNRDELVNYYREYYVPANMIVAIAGNIDVLKMRDYIETKMSGRQGKAPLAVPQETFKYVPFVKLVPKDLEQIQLCVGVPGISYQAEERYIQNVLNSILGGGMSSRLFQRLREELGLAYSVYSYPANYSDTGLFSIYIGTSPARVGEFLSTFYEQMDEFIRHGVSQQEIARTQKLMKSSISLGLESVMNRMTRLGRSVLMYDQVISTEEIIEKVSMVDEKQVQEMANQLFKAESFSLAAIGDGGVLPGIEAEFYELWGKR